MNALPLMIALLAAPQPSPGTDPHAAVLVSLEGLRADTLERRLFLTAFHATLDDEDLPIQTRGASGWLPAEPGENRFRVIEGDPERSRWALDVVVTLPQMATATRTEYRSNDGRNVQPTTVRKVDPKRRASRRFGVAVVVRSATEVQTGESPEPARSSIAFPAPPAPDGGMLVPSPRGYNFPWAEAGCVTARLTLEALHRRSGDLSHDARVDLTPAIRIDADP